MWVFRIKRWIKIVSLPVLGLLLGTALGAASATVPTDVSEEFLARLQRVIEPIIQQLELGDFSPYYPLLHAEEYVEIQISEDQMPLRVYPNPQMMTPREALEAFERGYAIARVEAEGPFRLSGIDYAPGDYFLVLWITDRGFERFGINFLPRTPLLIFLGSSSPLVLIDFAIPREVAMRGTYPLEKLCFCFTQGAGAMVVDTPIFRMTLEQPTPYPIPVAITIPTAEQLFEQPEVPEPEEPQPPGCEIDCPS